MSIISEIGLLFDDGRTQKVYCLYVSEFDNDGVAGYRVTSMYGLASNRLQKSSKAKFFTCLDSANNEFTSVITRKIKNGFYVDTSWPCSGHGAFLQKRHSKSSFARPTVYSQIVASLGGISEW